MLVKKKHEMVYDVIVVGTGAAGCTVARDLTRMGKKVLMLEKGGRMEMMGTTLTVASMIDIPTLLRNYRDLLIFVNNYGGSSNIAAGSALPPPRKVFDPVGIDLAREAEEARAELWIQKLPDELVGENNLRLMEAANSMGYHWQKMDKFIDASRCRGLTTCMLGCKTGAKWTGRVFGDEAVAGGAELRLHAPVKSVIVENGRAVGVRLKNGARLYSKAVVLSAGGLSNVHLLRGAGIDEAGRGLCCDWLSFVMGIIPGTSASGSTPMSVGTVEHYESDDFILLPVMPNWAFFLGIAFLTGPSHLLKFRNYRKYSSIMVKVRDDTVGEIRKGSSFVKPLTDSDRRKLDRGIEVIRKIFRKAGAKDGSVYPMRHAGAHPSATCRIGHVLDADLATQVPGLYCCDASVVPSSLGSPVIWTIVALGKRLAKHLGNKLD